MPTALETYRRVVAEQPLPDDAWFIPALARARAGEDEARREICGSFLRLALAQAERACPSPDEGKLLDAVQDANGALWDAFVSFTGSSVVEFVGHAEDSIKARLEAAGLRP